MRRPFAANALSTVRGHKRKDWAWVLEAIEQKARRLARGVGDRQPPHSRGPLAARGSGPIAGRVGRRALARAPTPCARTRQRVPRPERTGNPRPGGSRSPSTAPPARPLLGPGRCPYLRPGDQQGRPRRQPVLMATL
eukprot:gene15386-biopygen5413